MSFTLAPELVWGLIPRFVGVVYVLAFTPLILLHEIIPGSHRLAPIRVLRERIRRDYPGPTAFLAQPTLLWINDSDAMQRGLAIAGCLCGGVAMYGGPLTPYALFIAWLAWLSLEPRGLMFPWDTMLLEIGFLVLFLPAPRALPSLDASALPLPSVAFMVRWLVLRLMLGFGKDKFLKTTKSDFLFLRGFFVWMPLPSPLGWYAHHAPAWALKLGLLFMFLAEIVAPVLGLFAGPLRLVAFVLLVGLMAGIHATGNWGFFNVAYALFCVCLLDTQSSIFDLFKEPWASSLTSFPDVVVHALMALLFLVSLFYLPNNSFLTRSWVNWTPEMFPVEAKDRRKAVRIHRLLTPLRLLAPFRIVNGYGVFPPHSAPPIRLLPVLEGSADGVHWKQYGYRYMPSFATSRPPFVAPYHPRFDQWTYYVTMGIDAGSLFGALFPMSLPYHVSARASVLDLLMQRVLAGDEKMTRILGHNPFPEAPPKWMRVGMLAMTPTLPSELRATGHWWHIRRVGTLYPARGLESWPDRLVIPEPEVFHPD
ncbi:MAG TPA: lipase maturation factor family protein, partial [Polyangiaceae bacterium]|nr:lipase maturation factor family protein [Polyangiaceae bacterium]